MTKREKPGKKHLTNKEISLAKLLVVARACTQVASFKELYDHLDHKIVLSGRSRHTLESYGRLIAQVALHFNRLVQLLRPRCNPVANMTPDPHA